jgi:hypothetical protein
MITPSDDVYTIVGLHLICTEGGVPDETVHYDLGQVAINALKALQVAVLAVEQCCMPEKRLVTSLHVAEFYECLGKALEVENGQGILSGHGSMDSLIDEIQGLVDLVQKARDVAEVTE